MRAAWACVATIVAVLGSSSQAAEQAVAVLHVRAGDMQSLQDKLLELTQERLRPTGLFVGRQRTWMGLSSPLPAIDTFEVRFAWSADAPTPPLTFELRPKSRDELLPAAGRVSGVQPIKATLAVPLEREVWVAARRLRKGSTVNCEDLSVQRRDIREVPKFALTVPCDVKPGAVTLRDIAARDVIRSVDIGKALDVTAGAPVLLSVASRGINVTTSAIALADARVGDQIEVRLQRPARILRTRVIGPGSVKLMDQSP